jgi:hypothetical protein
VAIDPPWRLDPFKNIVGVGWGGGNVLVLRIDTIVNFRHAPRFTSIDNLDFTGSLIDAYANVINEHDAHAPAPTIVNPMSADMRAHEFMWSRPPYKLDSEAGHTWKALVFLNLSRIRSFLDSSDPTYSFLIQFPAGEHIPNGTTYFAFFNFGTLDWDTANEFPLLVPVFFTEEQRDNNTPVVTSNVQAFGSAADRDFFISLQSDPWGSHDEPDTGPELNDGLQWRVRGFTYRKRNDFPALSDNTPTWDEGTAIGSAEEHAESLIGVSVPAYTVTVTVNLETLSISMSKA